MLVLLLVSGVVTFMVLNATKQSKPSEAADSDDSDDSDPKTMAAADDDSPLGDTTEHSGEQSQEGETVRGPEGEGEGDGSASSSGDDADSGEERPRDTRPESERLANRDQV